MMWDDDDGFRGHYGMMYGGSAVTWLMLILMVALVVALVVAVVLLLRRTATAGGLGGLGGPGGPTGPEDESAHDRTAQRILAERLARGEIDEDEYRRRRAALSDT
jgi:putative membrane protein